MAAARPAAHPRPAIRGAAPQHFGHDTTPVGAEAMRMPISRASARPRRTPKKLEKPPKPAAKSSRSVARIRTHPDRSMCEIAPLDHGIGSDPCPCIRTAHAVATSQLRNSSQMARHFLSPIPLRSWIDLDLPSDRSHDPELDETLRGGDYRVLP